MRALLARHPVVLLVAVAVAVLVVALDRGPQETPGDGDFDFWLLALSWSPTYCLTDGRNDARQCGNDRPLGFIVHGLWPQFERGYPANCDIGPERIDRRFAEEMADLMPTPRLVFHQWRKHGRCSGMRPDTYFATVREAAGKVRIPARFNDPARDALMSPQALESAFSEANPGLDASEMAVICHRGQLIDIRICLTRDLAFRGCKEVDADACPAAEIGLPAPQ